MGHHKRNEIYVACTGNDETSSSKMHRQKVNVSDIISEIEDYQKNCLRHVRE
jgi:hypothetical protein